MARRSPTFAGAGFSIPGCPERCFEDFCSFPVEPVQMVETLHAAGSFCASERHHAPHWQRARHSLNISGGSQTRHISPLFNTSPQPLSPNELRMAGCFAHFCYNQMTNSEHCDLYPYF